PRRAGRRDGTDRHKQTPTIMSKHLALELGQSMIAPGCGNNQDTSKILAVVSDELDGDAAETTKIGVQRVALASMHHAGERAGQHQMPDLKGDAVLAELIGKPGDAERRMAEHAG